MSLYDDVRSRIRGLALNLPTPFRGPDFEIDFDGLRGNIERNIAAGVPVMLLTYGTSEYYVLSDDEIRQVTRATVEAVRGRACVVAATGRWWTGQAVEFARFCEDLGADCLMLTKLAPDWIKSDEDVIAYHRRVAERTRIPLMYHQEITGPRSIDLTLRIAEIEHVVALKQEQADYNQYVALGRSVAGRLAVVCGGGAPLAHWAHQFGAAASLTGVGQWAPGPEKRYVDMLLAGDVAAAQPHLEAILPYRLLAARLGNHPAIKYAMDLAGFAGGLCRPPGQNLSPGQKAQLEPVIRQTLRSLAG